MTGLVGIAVALAVLVTWGAVHLLILLPTRREHQAYARVFHTDPCHRDAGRARQAMLRSRHRALVRDQRAADTDWLAHWPTEH